MYMGLDCSSKAVHAVLLSEDGSLVRMEKFAPVVDDFDKRMFAITDSLYSFASIIEVTTAAIEAAIFIQNPRTTMQISSVVACAKYALHRASISVVPVDNRSWKKVIIGKSLSKIMLMLRVSHYGLRREHRWRLGNQWQIVRVVCSH